MTKEKIKTCSDCDGKKVNTRGQRCINCNGTGQEPDEEFDDEYADILDEEPDEDEMEGEI